MWYLEWQTEPPWEPNRRFIHATVSTIVPKIMVRILVKDAAPSLTASDITKFRAINHPLFTMDVVQIYSRESKTLEKIPAKRQMWRSTWKIAWFHLPFTEEELPHPSLYSGLNKKLTHTAWWVRYWGSQTDSLWSSFSWGIKETASLIGFYDPFIFKLRIYYSII